MGRQTVHMLRNRCGTQIEYFQHSSNTRTWDDHIFIINKIHHSVFITIQPLESISEGLSVYCSGKSEGLGGGDEKVSVF